MIAGMVGVGYLIIGDIAMAITTTTIRSYQARLRTNSEQVALLSANTSVYSRGAIAALDMLLNFAAVIRPTDSALEDTVKTVSKKKKKQDEQEFVWTVAHSCFSNWFTLESDSVVPDHAVLHMEDNSISELFHERWKAHGGGEIPATLETHIKYLSSDSMRKESRWIDRYTLGIEFMDQFKIPRKEAASLVTYLEWPFILKGTADAALKARVLCGILWGNDEGKSDWDEITKFYARVKQVIDQDVTGQTFRSIVSQLPEPPPRSGPCDLLWGLAKLPASLKNSSHLNETQILEICQSELKIKLNSRKGIKEATAVSDSYIKLDNIVSEVQLDSLREQINKKISNAGTRSSLELSPEWRANLLNWLERKCGVPYQVDGSRRLSQYSQFIASAASALGPWKSSVHNQCKERHKARLDYDKVKDSKRSKTVQAVVDEYKKDKKQSYLRTYQFKRLSDAVTYCRQLNMTLAQAIQEVQASFPDDCGDINLLNLLATSLDFQDFSSAEKSLKIIANIDDKLETVSSLYNPTLKHFNGDRVAYPSFGHRSKSLPLGEISPDWNKNQFKLWLDLFNEQGELVRLELSANSKRFVKEILDRSGEYSAPRNHYLYGLQSTGSIKSDVVIPQITIQPYRNKHDQERFDVRLSVPLAKLKLSTQQIIGVPDLTILGIDRGWKNAAAFAVLKRTNTPHGSIEIPNRNPKTRSDRPSIHLQVTKVGFITDDQELSGGEVHDRLASCDRELRSSEIDFINSLNTKGPEATTYSQFQLKLAKYCKSLIREKGLKAIPEIKTIREFLQDNPIRNQRGGLTFTRIDALEMFQRVYGSLIRICEDEKVEAPDWIISSFTNLSKSRVTRRRERARITASKIVALAIQEKCHCISIENLTLGTASAQTKSRNKRISQWMHRAVLQMLEQACELHGIYLKAVIPFKTSIRDSTSPGRECCRFTAMEQDPLRLEKVIRNSFINDHHTGIFAKAQRQWYSEMAAKFGIPFDSHHANELAMRVIAQSRVVPSSLGELFPAYDASLIPQRAIGAGSQKYIDSDINAAVNISTNAFEMLLDLFSRKNQ